MITGIGRGKYKVNLGRGKLDPFGVDATSITREWLDRESFPIVLDLEFAVLKDDHRNSRGRRANAEHPWTRSVLQFVRLPRFILFCVDSHKYQPIVGHFWRVRRFKIPIGAPGHVCRDALIPEVEFADPAGISDPTFDGDRGNRQDRAGTRSDHIDFRSGLIGDRRHRRSPHD